jgi:EPS-associated MarR family transcriptional regulator
MLESKDKFEILRKLHDNNNLTQRDLSNNLGFSLGKLNYCLKYLKKHGLIKISRFKKSKNKKKYLYLLTPKGLKARSKLTIDYMKLKIKEYDELKKESKKLKYNFTIK